MSRDPAQAHTWYRIENKADTRSAAIYLYDEVGSWGIAASQFVKELQDLRASKVDVHVNSPGGECYEGLAIFNALRNHKAEITVYIDGLAASAASFIAMAGDRIVAERNATLMIHNAHAVGVGDAGDMRKLADMLDRMTDTIASIYSDRAGGTVAQWRARMATETWFSADEAQAAGLVDEVASTPAPKSMPRNTWDLSIFNFAGRDAAPDPFAPLAEAMPMPPRKKTPDMPADMPADMPMLAVGDRVQVAGTPHEPGQATGTVAEVEHGPAYGIRFDGGGDPGGDVHRWYVAAELAPAGAAATNRAEAIPVAEAVPVVVAEDVPLVLAAFDPAQFRDAVNAASVLPFDPADFRDAMASLAHDAPAPPANTHRTVDLGPQPEAEPAAAPANPWNVVHDHVHGLAHEAPAPPTIQPTPVDLGPLPQPAEPVPEPPPLNPWDQLRAAVRIAANNAPAPPQPNSTTTTESPAEEPGFSMDAPAFRTALRRAKL